MSINYITAPGETIGGIVQRIEGVIHGELNSHISIACLVVSILAQNPKVSPEKLMELVKETSEFIVTKMSYDEELVH